MVSKMVRVRIAIVLLASIALPMAGQASGGYSIVDLGPSSPGSIGVGNAINATGGVAGTLSSGYTSSTAEATAVGGAFSPVSFGSIAAGSSTATGINDSGQVTGSFFDTAENRTHAYRTVDGKAVDLGALDGEGSDGGTIRARDTVSAGINGAGQVVGTSTLSDATSRAFRGGAGGGLSFLPLLGDGQSSRGAGINAGGQVVGSFELTPGVNHAFYTDTNNNPVDLLTKYGTPGFGLNTFGTAINASGSMVGYGDFGLNFSHAFLAPSLGGSNGPGKTPLIDLGVLSGYTSSFALGINSSSRVVGKLDMFGANSSAFVYDPTLGMIDLRSLLGASDRVHWTRLTLASAINDGLQITGQGLVDGQLHAFLMTPTAGQPAFTPSGTVPAPPALVLSGLGCAIAGAFARLRRGRTGVRAAA